MATSFKYPHATVKVYHGYGHTHDLVVYGHVFAREIVTRPYYSNNILFNIIHLFKLFMVKPISRARVQLKWGDQVLESETEEDGFFKFEWASETEVHAGRHPVVIHLLSMDGRQVTCGEGIVIVPHSTQFSFISDIDDTVLISHSRTFGKRMRLLFTRNPRTRKAFVGVVNHYSQLAQSHTKPDTPNPFFYVSSSEWNLYDDLNDFFKYNGLPPGIFMLNQLKRWYQLLKTGKTKHEGKLARVVRILNTFPKQRFVLLGDNSQSDPMIYSAIAHKHPSVIFAVYIRLLSSKKEMRTKQLMAGIQKLGVHTCLFKDNGEAIEHSKSIGLIG